MKKCRGLRVQRIGRDVCEGGVGAAALTLSLGLSSLVSSGR